MIKTDLQMDKASRSDVVIPCICTFAEHRRTMENDCNVQIDTVLFLAGILDLVLVIVFLTKCFLVLVRF